jgi:hypothetical protein
MPKTRKRFYPGQAADDATTELLRSMNALNPLTSGDRALMTLWKYRDLIEAQAHSLLWVVKKLDEAGRTHAA